nr:RimK-like ATPgrasp N-terminal domain-containing protein [Candidatus Njordarchaeota archaeon]
MEEGDSSSGDEEDSDSDSDSDSVRNGDGGRQVGWTSVDHLESPSIDREVASQGSVPGTGMSKLLVVCDTKIELADVPSIRPTEYLRASDNGRFVINVSHDYRYMKMGYYVSLHAELLGDRVVPSCSDALDVYRSPILLLRSFKAGIPVVPNLVTDSAMDAISKFDLPLIVFPLKPFPSCGFNIVYSKSGLETVMKRLTMNRRYTVCVEPLRGQLASFKSVFGTPIPIEVNINCDDNVRNLAKRLFYEFKVPLFKFFVQREGDQVYLCGIDPLKKSRKRDLVEFNLIPEGIKKLGEELV